ncbi:MAG TPA: hypothetical protein EYP02_07885, partial [Sulfurovum sp.]|nr:hypothetical protein [Sulfurovum sp.]
MKKLYYTLKYALKKEFISMLRNPSALLPLFIMPMIFILIMSLAQKDIYKEYTNADISYVIVNLDKEAKSIKFIEKIKEEKQLVFIEKDTIEEANRLTLDEVYKFT